MFINYFLGLMAFLGFLLIINKNQKISFYIGLTGILVAAYFTYKLDYYQPPIGYLSFLNFSNINYTMAIVFSLAFIIGNIFILMSKVVNFKEMGLIFIYFSCAIGVIFAQDFITLFIFWEILALAATFIILSSSNPKAYPTALKYFTIHALAGIFLIIGIVSYVYTTGTTLLPTQALSLSNPFNYFIFIAILICLGFPPFSSWLIEGYSYSSSTASIFLSIFTTKVAIFTLFKLFYNQYDLLYFGIILAAYGIIFSLFTSNIRKILSFAIIQQLGITMIAIAFVDFYHHTFLISYLISDILYKLGFFMIVAILSSRFNTDNIYRLRKSINLKSFIGVMLIILALQALGAPFTGGFITKTYLTSTVSETSSYWVNYILMFFIMCGSLNIGIRIPYTLLNFGNTGSKITLATNYKVVPFLVLIVVLEAIFLLHYASFFNLANIWHSLQVIGGGLILFILINRFIKNKHKTINLNINKAKNLLRIFALNFLQNMIKIDLIFALNKTAKILYNKITAISYQKYSYSSPLTFYSLVILILLYFILS
ncbi:Na(+)/H(+) antiporter subunit D [Candidatus Hepatincolaceae symbiont of Richtersius coronifer]